MQSSDQIEALGKLFERRQYRLVIDGFNKANDLHFSQIENEYHAEICALLAFSFFNTDQFTEAIKYSLMLKCHLEKQKQIVEAEDLYKSIIETLVKCYVRLGDFARAYSVFKASQLMVRNFEIEFLTYIENIKDELSDRWSKMFRYFVFGLSILLVGSQSLFKVFNRPFYLTSVFVLLVCAYLIIFAPKSLAKLMRTLL